MEGQLISLLCKDLTEALDDDYMIDNVGSKTNSRHHWKMAPFSKEDIGFTRARTGQEVWRTGEDSLKVLSQDLRPVPWAQGRYQYVWMPSNRILKGGSYRR